MERPKYEVSRIINRFGMQYIDQCQPNSFTLRTLDALQKCRTSALGGHIDRCDSCSGERNSYNSCGNRNCPKCQANKQALWPVRMLSAVFRGKLLEKIKRQLKQSNQLTQYQSLLDDVWKKPWVVYCEPPLGNAQQIVKYLGQYTHRVAISNHRIQNIEESGVSFFYKDYKDNSKRKLTKLSGVEFLRRFCMHILPYRFVKIRYYGILSTKHKDQLKPLQSKKPEKKVKETTHERILRLTGFDRIQCPFCKTGTMHTVELLPRIRSPGNVLFKTVRLSV